ncbi:MAG: hypothetical protein PF693_11845 [Spirochaetia bacterium]|nr:hypothetical protein [Spirochaetia bacterium]
MGSVVSAPGAVGTYFFTDTTTQTPTFVTEYYTDGGTSFTTPAYMGNYTLRLTVTDEYGLTNTDDVVITIANLAPNANLVDSGIPPAPESPVSLNGSSSTDSNFDRRQTVSDFNNFFWAVVDSPNGSDWQWNLEGYVITNFSAPDLVTKNVNFSPRNSGSNAGEGVYTVNLTVTDEYGSSNTETIIIPTSGNTAPALSTLADIVSVEGNNGTGTDGDPFYDDDTSGTDDTNDTFTLNASTSITNTDDDTLEYSWVIVNLTGSTYPDLTQDLSITVTVSDADLDDTADIWFDLY